MARFDVERKRKTPWPWFAGLAVLIVIVWGVTTLLTEDPDTEPDVVVPTVEDTHPPAAVPAPPYEDGADGTSAARDLQEIAPLGEEDIGQTVRVAGQVVATGNSGFWLLAGDNVVRVDSERRVRKGDSLSIEGTIRPGEPGRIRRIADVLDRQDGSEAWKLVGTVKLVEDGGGEPADARA